MIMYLANYNPANVPTILRMKRSEAFGWLILLNEHYEELNKANENE